MFDYLHFDRVAGSRNERDLTLFSLTTCGFCRRARAYLDSLGFEYRILYADELEPEIKNRLKQDFRDHFGEVMHFPTLILDGKDFLVGFVRPHWEMELEGLHGNP